MSAPKSWKVEVIADDSGLWVSNLLRFASMHEALDYGADLAARWTLVRDYRVVTSDDAPTVAAGEAP